MRPLLVQFILAGILGADQKIGKPLTLPEPVPLTDIAANPARFVDKTVQVRGRVTEVCEMMGCWMNLVDPSGERSIRIKVNDGDLVFPKSSVGKIAIAEGKLSKLVLTREQALARAKHEAEEQGRKFDPASVKSGATIYQIQGSGAVIMD